MATTLPGAPHPDESELDTLPVEPEFAPVTPEEPNEGEHEPVPKPTHWPGSIEVSGAPGTHRLGDGGQAPALVGQHVFEPRRPLVVERAVHESVVFHRLQARR